MIKLQILQDEELQNALKVFVSSLLPHSGYDPGFFSQNLNSVLRYIHIDEMQMEYNVVFSAFVNLNKIKMSLPDFEPSLTRESFDSLLQVSLPETILRQDVEIQEWLRFENLADDLKVQTTRELASQKLYYRCMELYDECYSMAVKSSEAINHEAELKAAFLGHVSVQSLDAQAKILQHELRVGRNTYRGSQAWLEYSQKVTSEINERLLEVQNSSKVVLDNIGVSSELLRSLSNLYEPIADWGIPELDDATPILQHRLVVVVGAENIGKTKFAVDKAVNVIRAGGKVAYMCGESIKAQVYADILINYIWKEYDVILQPKHLTDMDLCTTEVQKIIGMAIDRITSTGALTLRDAYNYHTVYQEMEEDYQISKFDMLVIDHSLALVGGGGDKIRENIDTLAIACREFKKAHPVCVLVTSHPSVSGKDDIRRGKKVTTSSTKGSQTLSGEADEVFTLRDNETLQKQQLLLLDVSKRRGPAQIDPIVLKKKFEVSAVVYDAEYQAPEAAAELEQEEALRLLNQDLDDYSLMD